MPLVFTRLACPDDVRSLVAGRRVAFLKGFGPSVDFSLGLPPGLLPCLQEAEIVVFDGDDFVRDSFTRMLEALCQCSMPAPRFLAFKLEDDEARLLTNGAAGAAGNWTGAGPDCFHPQGRPLSAHYYLVPEGPACEGLDMDASVLAQASSEVRGVEDACREPGSAKYIRLGVRAVELVLSGRPTRAFVAALGGYAVVLGEFAHGLRALGAAMLQWHYFHARRSWPGRAEWQQGLLHSVRHERLQHHAAPVIEYQEMPAP
jgi:hypothetical protein